MDRKIVFCNCGGSLLKPELKSEIFDKLNQEGVAFSRVSDLCGLCTDCKEDIQQLMTGSDEILIIACHPRAVKLLLDQTGINGDSFNYLNFLEFDKDSLIENIKAFSDSGTNISSPSEIKSSSGWEAWYPLIDYTRCTSCGQCADFCLFGVYEKKDNKVIVVNPEGCKNNCPACARICPHTAIIFPKYEHGGAIAGADSINEVEEQQRQRLDIDSILGSEIYQALEKRKLKRQSIIRNSTMQQAMLERDKALNERKEN